MLVSGKGMLGDSACSLAQELAPLVLSVRTSLSFNGCLQNLGYIPANQRYT